MQARCDLPILNQLPGLHLGQLLTLACPVSSVIKQRFSMRWKPRTAWNKENQHPSSKVLLTTKLHSADQTACSARIRSVF